MPYYPVNRDRRYTVTIEFCGYATPRFVARFCGDWLGCSISRASAAMLAIGAHQRRIDAKLAVRSEHACALVPGCLDVIEIFFVRRPCIRYMAIFDRRPIWR